MPAGTHDQAANVLQEVSGSNKAVADLSRLLNIKTASQYTAKSMTERQATDAITRARRLIAFAESRRR